jgi:hypothetical protein
VTTLLLQQQAARPRTPLYWAPETIAAILGSPVENVKSQWPLVLDALREFGIDDFPTQVAAIATIGVESGTFLPVREAWWLDEDYRRRNFRYYPYYGRGLIQLTWLSNYQAAEEALGIVGLADNPDLALEQGHSARIFAWFFATHDIAGLARRGLWISTRIAVNGGTTGIVDYMRYVENLQGAAQRAS